MGLPLFVTPPDNGISPRPGDKDTSASNDRTTIRRQRTVRRGDLSAGRQRIRESLLRNGAQFTVHEPRRATVGYEEDAVQAAEDRAAERASLAAFTEDRRRRAQMHGAPIAIPSPWADRSTPPLPRAAGESSTLRVMPSNPWGWNAQSDAPPLPPAPESPPSAAHQMGGRLGLDRRVALQRLYDERTLSRRRARNTAAQNAAAASQTETTPLLSGSTRSRDLSRPLAADPSGRLAWAEIPFGYQMRNPSVGASTISLFESGPGRHRFRLPRVDGLGDRDRSLSPEGDGAWDTLLTTISPDPQPPSVGSSFASTSASAAATNASNTESSATSMAPSVDNADDNTFENVCEYVENHSPAPGTDEEEEMDIYELDDAQAAGERFWRGYADVVVARADRVARHAGQTESDSLGGMQRIVRRLARREDIPDEWWAEAGLSRTLPRELVH